MRTNIISSKQTFEGIKLSNNSFKHVGDVVMHLQRTGYDWIGRRTFCVNNSFVDKRNAFDFVRRHTLFSDKEFGALFFSWSKEAYIIANPEYEQLMLPVIRQLDEKANINILM